VQQASFTYCDPTSPDAQNAANTAGCTIPERFGPEAAGGRPYDNVNDYVAASNTPAATFTVGGLVVNANNEALANANYTATVLITPESLGTIAANPAPGNPADAEVLRITIKVSFGSESITLDGYRTRYAPVPQ
jgi:MSHA pilin protein MshD